MGSRPRFKIVCTGFEAMRWLPRCLKSISGQDYPDFDVVVADDGSSSKMEGTFIAEFCRLGNDMPGNRRWVCIARKNNVGVLASQHECIHAICTDPDDVIVIVDSDDFLPSPGSLSRLAGHYDEDTLMTYGSYASFPFSSTCPPAIPFPKEVIEARSFREFIREGGPVSFNHLRTYRYGLYNQIPPDPYFKRRGQWLKNGVDVAVMVPCLELAGPRHKVIEDELLAYNSVNPLSFWRTRRKALAADDHYILRLPPLLEGKT